VVSEGSASVNIGRLIINDLILLELKAVRNLDPSHEAQSLNYLRATEIEVALLLNFGPKPHFKRFVFDNTRTKNPCSFALIRG